MKMSLTLTDHLKTKVKEQYLASSDALGLSLFLKITLRNCFKRKKNRMICLICPTLSVVNVYFYLSVDSKEGHGHSTAKY